MSDAAALVREIAARLGFEVVGVASIARLERDGDALASWLAAGRHAGMAYLDDPRHDRARPAALLPGSLSVVTVAVEHDSAAPAFDSEGRFGRVARYAWGRDYHEVLAARLVALADELARRLGRGVRSRALVDGAPVLERALAVTSGLGFVGRNTAIIGPERGSWWLLGEVLVDVDLEPTPAVAGSCGSCRRCLDACPTGALDEEYRLDARKCLSYWTVEAKGPIPREWRAAVGPWVFGCDVCQEVCPFNRFAKPARWPELSAAAGVGPRLDLIEVLSIESDEEFRARFRGTALLRAKRRGLLRNAAVVARNVGATAAVPALRLRALFDAEPVVRGHAIAALGGLDASVARPIADWLRSMDPDAFVREEAEHVLADSAEAAESCVPGGFGVSPLAVLAGI